MNYPIFFSSHNPDKVQEVQHILAPYGIKIYSKIDYPALPDTIEDREDIYGNAIKKAMEGAFYTRMLSLADDTGLFIEAMKGAPGVLSARWAGNGCSYRDNRLLVLKQMEGIEGREAVFETAMALANANGLIGIVKGQVQGLITREERGENGFGYDNIFEIRGIKKTYAELEDAEKNRISHRAYALQNMIPILKRVLMIDK